MKRTLAITMIIAAAVLSATAQCSDGDKKALEALDRAWTTAGQKGDRAALNAIYADDYVGFPGMQGKAAAVDATMDTFERNRRTPPTTTTTADHYLIMCSPVSATVTHRNTTVAANGTTTYSRSVHILEKRGGKWQVVSNAGNALDDSSIIWYLEQDWNDAVLKKNKAWFEKNYASDFTSISSTTGALLNRAAAIADDTDPNVTMEIVETTDMNVRVDGDRAVVTGVFRTKGRDRTSGPFDRKIRYTDTWIKRDGRWQAWASQGTTIQ